MLFISSALSTVILGAILAQAKELAAGKYHIMTGDKSVRSFPIYLPEHEAPISVSGHASGSYGQWNVSRDGHGAYLIRNVGNNAKAYGDQTLNAQVQADLNDQTAWFIEDKGSGAPGEAGSYVIKIPFQDLVWTNTPRNKGDNVITLKGSDGSAEQRFAFKPVN